MTSNMYSGRGSRNIPYVAGFDIARYAERLGFAGFKLRSGKAKGADRVFELNHAGPMELFADDHESIPDEAYKIAADHHPAWHKCNEFARNAHGRNALILLGQNLDDPVDFDLVWTQADIEGKGGTALGMRIARTFKIPRFNIRLEEDMRMFSHFLHATYPKLDIF